MITRYRTWIDSIEMVHSSRLIITEPSIKGTETVTRTGRTITQSAEHRRARDRHNTRIFLRACRIEMIGRCTQVETEQYLILNMASSY